MEAMKKRSNTLLGHKQDILVAVGSLFADRVVAEPGKSSAIGVGLIRFIWLGMDTIEWLIWCGETQ
jgi:hypothetical protein